MSKEQDCTMPVVELVDEEGETTLFEHLMTLEHQKNHYVVLFPLDTVEGVGEDEVMIMRIDMSGEEDTYFPVEDEQTLEEVFALFLDAMEDEEE